MSEYASRVTLVIVTYNSAAVIARCLDAVPEGIARVMVVDNASTDGTIQWVARRCPRAEIVRNPSNLGFGRANNLALRRVETEFALLVNPDARLDLTCVRELVAGADRYPEAMILAPLTYNDKGVSEFSYANCLFSPRGIFVVPEGDLCAACLSGAVMLLRMSHLRDTGLFDEHIFMYFEDEDLCLRARAQGYTCLSIHKARAFHGLGVSAPRTWRRLITKERAYIRSYLYLQGKYRGPEASNREAGATLRKQLELSLGYIPRLRKNKLLKSLGQIAGALEYLVQRARQGTRQRSRET